MKLPVSVFALVLMMCSGQVWGEGDGVFDEIGVDSAASMVCGLCGVTLVAAVVCMTCTKMPGSPVARVDCGRSSGGSSSSLSSSGGAGGGGSSCSTGTSLLSPLQLPENCGAGTQMEFAHQAQTGNAGATLAGDTPTLPPADSFEGTFSGAGGGQPNSPLGSPRGSLDCDGSSLQGDENPAWLESLGGQYDLSSASAQELDGHLAVDVSHTAGTDADQDANLYTIYGGPDPDEAGAQAAARECFAILPATAGFFGCLVDRGSGTLDESAAATNPQASPSILGSFIAQDTETRSGRVPQNPAQGGVPNLQDGVGAEIAEENDAPMPHGADVKPNDGTSQVARSLPVPVPPLADGSAQLWTGSGDPSATSSSNGCHLGFPDKRNNRCHLGLSKRVSKPAVYNGGKAKFETTADVVRNACAETGSLVGQSADGVCRSATTVFDLTATCPEDNGSGEEQSWWDWLGFPCTGRPKDVR